MVLMGKLVSIEDVVGDTLFDADLPFTYDLHNGEGGLRPKRMLGTGRQNLDAYFRWQTTSKELFSIYQWQMISPYFAVEKDNVILHYPLEKRHIFLDRRRAAGPF